MAARSSWKGFLKLSLVSVPVKVYTVNIRAKVNNMDWKKSWTFTIMKE
jgi:non-homologous end joining protein Ku